ncbi:MAG: hypothetical protein ACRC8S_20945, partial [Fimbriiglobus sp.]
MMTAIISGRLTKAFVPLAEGQWEVLRYGDRSPSPCDQRFVLSELRECRDAHTLTGDLDTIRHVLCHAVDLTESVDLTLWLLDPILSDDIRQSTAEELEEILVHEEMREAWANLFWAKPLTADADIEKAIILSAEAGATHTHDQLAKLHSAQKAIAAIRTAWDRLRVDPANASEKWPQLEAWGLRAGLFPAFVKAYIVGSQELEKQRALWSMKREAIARNRSWPAICKTFVKHLGSVSAVYRVEIGEVADAEIEEHRKTNKEKRERDRAKEPRGYDRKAALQYVESEKKKVIQYLEAGEYERVRTLANNLMEHQMQFGGATQAVKTLCDLAQRAYELDEQRLQFEWAKHATELVPDDSWALTQYGHALRLAGKHDEAMQAYESAEGYSKDLDTEVVARNGRAEVLKSMERYEDALKLYEQIGRDHPTNVVAKNGRAEVLKAMECY